MYPVGSFECLCECCVIVCQSCVEGCECVPDSGVSGGGCLGGPECVPNGGVIKV